MTSRLTAGAALTLLMLLHIWSVAALIARPPFLDETEALQAGVRIARGERLYQNFAEHHPPFLFSALASFAPAGGSEPIKLYVIRARILFAFFGSLAIAAAASIVWFASRRASAVILFTALLLNDPGLWLRAFADVRADPPSLALWWLGAALIVLPAAGGKGGAMLRGLGLGLIAHACLWNPKWPVASAVMGGVFLVRLTSDWRRSRGDAITGAIVAMAVTAGGVALMAMLVDLRTVAGNVFGLTRALVKWSDHLQAMHIAVAGPEPVPWLYCPPLFHPRYVLPAAAITLVAMLRAPQAFGGRRLVATLLALIPATLTEIRFLYPYPAPWGQYYILWSMAGAATLALAPQAVVALFSRAGLRIRKVIGAAPIAVAALAMVAATNLIPVKSIGPDPYWQSFAYLHRHLQPSDRVWTDLPRYPLGARDAGYYWFGFDRLVPVALEYAQTPEGSRVLPAIREQDLPPCRLERGLEPNLRFLAGEEQYRRLQIVAGCFARLRAAGVVVPTPVPGIYAVIRRAVR
jgi:hypothetical protein